MARQYFTTGEAAEICGISRSTIARRFDRGELKGPKNAVTSERRIARESLLAFMQDQGIAVSRLTAREQSVLLASARAQDQQSFRAALTNDAREATVAGNWLALAEALNHHPPGLLILDAGFPGLMIAHVLETIADRESLRDMKVVLLADTSVLPLPEAVARHKGLDLLLRTKTPETMRDAFRNLLAASAPAPAHPEERRASPRAAVHEDTEITVVLKTGKRHAEGHARLDNISEQGAWLSHIQLGNKPLPTEPFHVRLTKSRGARLSPLQADLQPLRLAFEKGLSLGGRFTALAEEDRQKIRQLFSSAP